MDTRWHDDEERPRESWALTRGIEPTGPVACRIHIGPGRKIPGTRYRAIRWLGEGGMGVVYEAEHLDVGRRFAVKILRHGYCGDPEATQLFRQEARATARVGSDNILEVYDFAELPDGRLMMAMELLDGIDLFDLMGEPMEPGRAIAILRQCCRGLAAAHAAGLVHRDVKPENILLVDDNGRPDKVKLVDFGIAVMLSGRDRTVGRLLGTPAFLAPEMICHGEIGPAADQYALGCVAFEMLTGRPVFAAPSTKALLEAQVSLDPPIPSQVLASLPDAFDAVIRKCLAKHPGDRFASMAQMEAALCEAQIAIGARSPWDDLPLPEVDEQLREKLMRGMPQPEQRAQRAERKLRWFTAVAAGVVLATGGIATAWTFSSAEASVESAGVFENEIRAARDAAARFAFVYPPADDPQMRTAYRIVRDLEATTGKQGAGAREVATELRAEFGQTLAQLGDAYWELEGGRRFAMAYYEQAMLFEPGLEPARSRADLTPHELASLQDRANMAIFSNDELVAAEPLVVLAERDEDVRQQKLRAYRERREHRDAKLDRTLAALTGKSASQDAAAPAQPATSSASDSQATEPVSLRDPDKGRDLADKGRRAIRRGEDDSAKVLFEQALAQNSRDETALAGLRDLYFDRGDYGRAATYGRRLVEIAGRNADHRLRLGDAYFKIARYEDAQTQYAKAVRLGDGRAKWRLRKARQRLGR